MTEGQPDTHFPLASGILVLFQTIFNPGISAQAAFCRKQGDLKKFGILIIFKLCIYVCGYVHENTGPQKRTLDPLQPGVEVVGGHLM